MDIARLAATLAGVGSIGYGGWLHYPPFGFILAGVLLVAFGLIGALRSP